MRLVEAVLEALVETLSVAFVKALLEALDFFGLAFVVAILKASLETLAEAFVMAFVVALLKAFIETLAVAFVKTLVDALAEAFVMAIIEAFVEATDALLKALVVARIKASCCKDRS